MSSVRDAEVLALIQRLTSDVEVARSHSLDHTARLLEIAILDLRTILASMSDADLRNLTESLCDELYDEKVAGHC
jgi:hypothetical protein